MRCSAIRRTKQLKFAVNGNIAYSGELVSESSKKVPIIELADPFNPVLPKSSEHKFAKETIQGKTYGGRLLIMPKYLTDVVSHHTWNVSPEKMRANAASYYKALPTQGHKPSETVLDVETHMTAIFLQNYASCSSVLGELQRRTAHSDWSPKRVLDIGYGPATGIVAFNEVYGSTKAEKIATIMGHESMKKRARALLKSQNDEETKVIDELPGNENPANHFDLIIACHQLTHDKERNIDYMMSLLAKNGVLVLIERGDPVSFEHIARARQILIRPENSDDDSKTPRPFKKTHVQIIAPCPHHGKCPLQVGLEVRDAGKNPGWFQWCHFGQMIQRPKFTQELKKGAALSQEWTEEGVGIGGKSLAGSGRPGGKSYETANYSYLIVRNVDPKKEMSNPQENESARILRSPLKRDKHIMMEVCAPSSNVEHWTVPQSYGKQAYRDAKRADGGDLWQLGAKTIQIRGGNELKLKKLTATNKLVRRKFKPGRTEAEQEEKAWKREKHRSKGDLFEQEVDLYEMFKNYNPGKEE